MHWGWGKSLAHAPLLLLWMWSATRGGTVCDERRPPLLPALLWCHFRWVLWLLWRSYRGWPGTDVTWRATLARHWELLSMPCMYGATARATLSSSQRTHLLFRPLQQRWLTISFFVTFLLHACHLVLANFLVYSVSTYKNIRQEHVIWIHLVFIYKQINT